MRAFRLAFAVLIAATLVAGGVWLASPPPASVDWERLQGGVTIATPPGDGPFPVVLLLHGCNGADPFLERYAEAAVEAGAAAITLDSYGPRGVGRLRGLSNCAGLGPLRGARAEDIALTLDNLNDPRLDASRVALAGWSAGAWSVTEFLIREPEARRARAAFLVYPHCGRQGRWPATQRLDGVTIMVVSPTLDRRGHNPACLAALERSGASIVEVENATHAFENVYPRWFPYRHDAAAFEANALRFRDFLRATLTQESAAPFPADAGGG